MENKNRLPSIRENFIEINSQVYLMLVNTTTRAVLDLA